MNHAQLVKASIAKRTYAPVGEIGDDLKLGDLALDSFALVELLIELEETSGICLSAVDLAELGTVGELIAVIERKAPRTTSKSVAREAAQIAPREVP